jgi:methionine synthase II (cobalamin-independent)
LKVKKPSEIVNMSKVHRNPPFRAEHLGSLLRPKDFLAQRSAFEKSEISQEILTKAEDEAIAAVVKVQLENNFHAITDGEYRYILKPEADMNLG